MELMEKDWEGESYKMEGAGQAGPIDYIFKGPANHPSEVLVAA